MRLLSVASCLLALVAVRAQAEETPVAPDHQAERQAIQHVSDDYCAAYSAGDVEALMKFWLPDAEYLDGQGDVYHGQAEIAPHFKEQFATQQGYKLQCEITSLRFYKADLALEDGVAEITAPDGETTVGRYNAVWVKNGDTWQLARVQDLPGEVVAPVGANYDRLAPLAGLLGQWSAQDPVTGTIETLSCDWDESKNFIDAIETVATKNGDVITIERKIGWDPVAKQIKTWFFDSKGAHGEGTWTVRDDQLTETLQGALPDGRQASSQNELQLFDDNQLVWTMKNRQIDEVPLHNSEHTFHRTATP